MDKTPKIKLTQYSSGAGWACKIGAKELTQVLSKLNIFPDKKNQSGFENFDDCAIYKLNDKQSIIQTVDFFTPIVDDPYTFGVIAAANSLSDIYAMGGKPLFALNIVAFPIETLNLDVLSEILQGGIDKCKEVNVNILGGHSIKDDTPKYGLAVTGIIDNNKILKNSSAKENDALILTKPLGTGIITTAIKKDKATKDSRNDVIKLMSTLNSSAARIIRNTKLSINACTDITGFGLLGHLKEICKSSNLAAKINFNSIPFLKDVNNFAKQGIIPGGTKNNLEYIKDDIFFSEKIETYQKYMLADAQTSGGLLISVPDDNAYKLLNELNQNTDYKSSIIGHLSIKKKYAIIVSDE